MATDSTLLASGFNEKTGACQKTKLPIQESDHVPLCVHRTLLSREGRSLQDGTGVQR